MPPDFAQPDVSPGEDANGDAVPPSPTCACTFGSGRNQRSLCPHVAMNSQRAKALLDSQPLDCAVIGGGVAGLTAAVYLARSLRSFVVFDSGEPRAWNIPLAHNIPGWPDGISGPDLLAALRTQADEHGAVVLLARVTSVESRGDDGTFMVHSDCFPPVHVRTVITASGAVDVQPDHPLLLETIASGAIHVCPVCEAFEVRGRRVGILGIGTGGVGEAMFLSRIAREVVLLIFGKPMFGFGPPDEEERIREKLSQQGILAIPDPVMRIDLSQESAPGGERIPHRCTAVFATRPPESFDGGLFSALGIVPRSGYLASSGVELAEGGCVILKGPRCETSVPGIYAAGGVAQGLVQCAVAMGHGATAAHAVHMRLGTGRDAA
ncbi:putative thioredoxin reductase [Hyaloraphidium curvatum]|nr:putative thioredoxin reductase [Hyaloraphidium curvatum]